ncbi:chromate efflux transporter [Paenibacillus filicis]|uniref:Chromate efflux transporter n=1 Tax=Paenibacillus gyeongsangnamensis TaxID=3388067 RepID=A0ABT4QJU7_9BACL|nr:chromate efflux transporter [Paenibacillus filicis]MCZ8517148.1 chromate efflux transporter [Paenibacillus filicis]
MNDNPSIHETAPSAQAAPGGSLRELFGAALKLGLTSFGGPVAHLGYFREEYVKRRQWLDEKSYADLVALCQFLPGPASSQVGISIGMMRAGILGGIVSWIGFTIPSALALAAFAFLTKGSDTGGAGWLHGLLIVSVAVVAQAVWGMARTLAPDRTRGTIAIGTAILTLAWPSAYGQLILIAAAGLLGRLLLPSGDVPERPRIAIRISRTAAILSWIVFFGLLLGLPLWRQASSSAWVAMIDSFYRVGSLVFGGGHVVLPMLQAELVPPGWMTDAQFLAGYGAAQAVPGPLFTLSAYLGAVMNGWPGALVALLAMFLPSFLLVTGSLPLWDAIRSRPNVQSVLKGVNASVVGILLAALYHPVWTSAIRTSYDFCLALAAFGLLMLWKLPPWAVVLFAAAGGALMPLLS